MSNHSHQAIRASAGSGKTYRLTSRYLQLHAENAPLSSILATTFTRAAAGEIRDRILLRLTNAVDDEDERRDLASTINKPCLARDEVICLIRGMVNQLHRLQIRTLDSFFAGVVHTFGLELGISPAVRLADEDRVRLLRADALAMVLERNQPQMVRLLRQLTRGNAGRAILPTLDRTVKDLHERCGNAPDAAWEILGPALQPLDAASLQSALERLEGIDHPKLGKTIRSDVRRFRDDGLETFADIGIAKNLARQMTTFGRTEIDEEIIEAYAPVLGHVAAHFDHQIRDRTTAVRELLSLFDDALGTVKRKQRLMTFSDFTSAMVRAVNHENMDEILFRLDAKIRHLLLDEFQDTSVDQFEALRPLAREILAGGTDPRTFFCVGDVKQSIYGWRDACPEILSSITTLLAPPIGSAPIEQISMQTSYRSSPVVIETVNHVFENLEGNPAAQDCIEAARQFSAAFSTHDCAYGDLPGVVQLRTSLKADGGVSKENTRLAAAAGLVGRLHRDAPGHQIGVLVSTNRAAATMLAKLGPTGEGLSVGVRGGGPLTDATPVNAVLDLLRLVDHADDTIAAFHVARGPLGPLVGLTDESDRQARIRVARAVADDLLRRGYAATLADIVADLASFCDAREYGRLHDMLQLAGGFDADPSLRADDFVRLVEGQSVPNHEQAAVEVMTVHQSKGLEFDLVVLPDLGGSRRSPAMAWRRLDDVGEIDAVCPWVSESIRGLLPELKPVHDATRKRQSREMFCRLYVAMTRARLGLFMIIDPPGKSVGTSTQAIVHNALAAGESGEDRILFESGNLDAVLADATAREAPGPPVSLPKINLAGAPTLHRPSTERLSASRLGHATHHLETDLLLSDPEGRERGTAVHALLATVQWLETLDSDDDRLRSIVRQATPRRSQSWHEQRIEGFRAMLTRPEVRRQLALDGRDGDTFELWCERPYARISPEGSVERGTIDRVEIEHDDATPVSAVVVDFKTETVDAADAVEAAEKHRRQLDIYRSVVAELTGLDPAEVRAVILFVESGLRVELDPATATGSGRSC